MPAHTLHVLIANALPAANALRPGLAPPPPPQPPLLQKAVRGLRISQRLSAHPDDLHTPLEQLLAAAHGLRQAPDGSLPWAAFETGTVGTACAWLRPCHWQIGLDQVQVLPPAELALTAEESQALLASVQPLLTEDGVQLRPERPDAWLATGERLHGLCMPSIQRAAGQVLARSALQRSRDAAQSAWLQRLLGELQMLLHEHPVNQAREAAGLWPVNAIWIDGAGTLAAAVPHNPLVRLDTRLDALDANDSTDRQQVWQTLDAELGRALLDAQQAHQPVQLHLCGPQHAITLASPRHLLERLRLPLRPLRWADLFKTP